MSGLLMNVQGRKQMNTEGQRGDLPFKSPRPRRDATSDDSGSRVVPGFINDLLPTGELSGETLSKE